jgi:uncharacterized protein YutE (UPF0331/DUF86 family)
MSEERFYSLSMILFSILNRTLDLGEEIVRGKKLGMPGTYQGIFQILEREKIISTQLSHELEYLAKQRNVLAHEYFDISPKSIFLISKKMEIVKEFIKIIYLLTHSKKGNGKK